MAAKLLSAGRVKEYEGKSEISCKFFACFQQVTFSKVQVTFSKVHLAGFDFSDVKDRACSRPSRVVAMAIQQ